jgi:hypothetical protein
MSCGCCYKDDTLQGGGKKSLELKYSLFPGHFSALEQNLFLLCEEAYKRAGFRVTQVPHGSSCDVIVHLTTQKEMAKLYPELKSHGLSLTDRSLSPMHIHLHLENWLHIPTHLGSDFKHLDAYRKALIEHELAHALGYDHVGCACKGCPRDTRQQPSRSSGGCDPNHAEVIINPKSPYSSVNF